MRILLVSILLLSLFPTQIQANEVNKETVVHFEDEVLWAARLAVHEAGFSNHAEHLAIWEVLKNRANRELAPWCDGDIACAVHRYSANRLRNPRTRRARWARSLQRDGLIPRHWPQHRRRWEVVKDDWLATVDLANRYFAGEQLIRCNGRLFHWGSMNIEPDRTRATRALRDGRWRRARCRTVYGIIPRPHHRRNEFFMQGNAR